MRLLSISSRGTAIAASFFLLLAPAYADEPGGQPGEMAPQGVQTEAAPEPATPLPRGVEEIVITANKRETNLQETPLAVSAFSQTDYEDFRIDSANDIALLVPSVSFFFGRLYIRGVGRTQNALGMDPGVASYNDGIYRSDLASVLYNSSFGTERLEIMRGPQGTLYGRNATGGAVNYVTQRPTDEFEYQGTADIGNYAKREYGLSVSGPITDWLRFKLLAIDNSRDGIQENIGTGRDFDSQNNRHYDVQLEADLTEDVSLWVKWTKDLWDYEGGLIVAAQTRSTKYIDDSPFGGTSGLIGFNNQFGCDVPEPSTVTFGCPPNPGVRNGRKSLINDVPSSRLQDTWSITAELQWDAGPVLFTYLYGYQTYDFNYKHGDWDTTSRTDSLVANISTLTTDFVDFGFDPFGLGSVAGANQVMHYVREAKTYYSHELNVASQGDGRFNWLASLYYYHEDIDQPFTLYKPFQSNLQNICVSCGTLGENLVPGLANFLDISVIRPNTNDAGGQNLSGITYYQNGTIESTAYSGHVELYYDLTETLRLTGGIRYSYDHKDAEETQNSYADPLFYNGFGASPGFPTGFTTDYEQNPFNGFGSPFGTPGLLDGDSVLQAAFGVPPVPNCCAWIVSEESRTLSDHWNAMTGRIILDWMPDDDTLAYAMYNVGYKSGGMRLGAVQPGDPTFPQEKVNAYEVGLKKTFLDRRVVLNTAAYWYWYKDMQVLKGFQGEDDPFPLEQVVSAPRTKFYGYEVEAKASVTDELVLGGNYSFNYGEFTRFCCAIDLSFPDRGDQDLAGNDTPQTPRNKWTVYGTYTLDSDWGAFSFTPRFSWVDKTTYNIFNNVYAPQYHRTDYTLSWTSEDGTFRLIAYLKNAEGDDNFIGTRYGTEGAGGFETPRSLISNMNAPRTYGVQAFVRY